MPKVIIELPTEGTVVIVEDLCTILEEVRQAVLQDIFNLMDDIEEEYEDNRNEYNEQQLADLRYDQRLAEAATSIQDFINMGYTITVES